MSITVSSFMPTANASVTRNRDQLTFPFLARPQAMTFYAAFMEQGSIRSAAGLSWRIFHLGDQTTAKNYLIVYASGGFYTANMNANGSFRSSTLATAPTIGDFVELRLTLTAGGVLQLSQTLNSGTEVNAAAAAATPLPQMWVNTSAAGDRILQLNAVGAGGNGFNAFIAVAARRGVQSLATMRETAGTLTRNG